MKHILALAAFAVTVATSQAASFIWGTGSVKSAFGDTTFNTAGNVGTMHLVLLGSTGTAGLYTVEGDSLTAATAKQDANPTTTGLASKKGLVTANYQASDIANDQVYGAYFTYTDAESNIWYNFSTTTYTVTGLSLGTETLSNAVFAFDFASKTETTADKVSVGGGWYHVTVPTVPEPGTAALALLGVGMLLKRRKA